MDNINNIKDIDIFDNDIDLYIKMFCEQNNISDLKAEPQNVWNACLMFISRHLFKHTNILKDKIINNYNIYDFDKVNNLCDYYIYLCGLYNKECSIVGFSYLSSINQDTIHDWNTYKGTDKLTSRHCEIYQKLRQARENSLSNKLADGKQNPVGVIAILNHHYNWSSPYTSDANKTAAQRISRQDAQKMIQENNDNNPALPTV